MRSDMPLPDRSAEWRANPCCRDYPRGQPPKPLMTDAGERFGSIAEAARALGTHKESLRRALRHGWRHRGRVWLIDTAA
jgi:hypothetical protein